MSVDLLDGHEVTDGVDHAAELRQGFLDDRVVDPLEAERPEGVPVVLLRADLRTGLGDLQTGHVSQLPTPARARRRAAGATSSSGSPRRAATSSGRMRPFRAATVAWTMWIGLSEPSDFVSTSRIPAPSSTARH